MGWIKKNLLGIHKSEEQKKKERDKKLKVEAHKLVSADTLKQTPQTPTPAQAQAPAETPQQELMRRQQELAQHVQLAKQAQQPGNVYGEEVRNRTIQNIQTTPGFRPEQAAAMQHQAYKNAQRMGQTTQRALLGEQSQRGIGGRSGIGYAQQRDINKGVAAQQAQSLRDFQKLNAEQGTAIGAAGEAARYGAESRMDTDIESQREAEERKKFKLANPQTQQFMRIG
jgi:hypothetical protein